MISLCEISRTLLNKHCIALLWYQTSSAKEMLCDWVQHKCQHRDLPLMRWHLWKEGRKLLLWKTHKKHTDVLLLRADKETLKGIKLFYISYICMSPIKCSTLFIYTVLGLWIQLRWRGIESVTVHQKNVWNLKHRHIASMYLEFLGFYWPSWLH